MFSQVLLFALQDLNMVETILEPMQSLFLLSHLGGLNQVHTIVPVLPDVFLGVDLFELDLMVSLLFEGQLFLPACIDLVGVP